MRPLMLPVALLALVSFGAGAGTSRLGIDRGSARTPLVHFESRSAGLGIRYPGGWDRSARLTKIVYPRERLALASYPLARNDTVGECQAHRSLARIPADGVFIYLLEYRPLRGRVWAEIRRADFRLRPKRFRIERADLRRGVGCYAGPSYSLLFRDANRPFDLFVAFGAHVSGARIAQAEEVLNSLRVRPPPTLPPDPYAGWKLLTTESGDSLRPPSRWSASVTFMPRSLPRPRPLFFASNLPLAGLPQSFAASVKQLPSPFPRQALDAFPAAGVLLWVLEEATGGVSTEFPSITRGWPADAFRSASSGRAQQ